MLSQGSSPAIGVRSPKLPSNYSRGYGHSIKGVAFSPTQSGKAGAIDANAEMERLEKDLLKVSEQCKQDGSDEDPTV